MKTKPCRIIFLDIDGVLNNEKTGRLMAKRYPNRKPDFPSFPCDFAPTYENTKNLLTIYQAFPNTHIVISSTWRKHLSHFGIWESLLYAAVHHEAPMRLHWRDPVTPSPPDARYRGEVIQLWLSRHPEVEGFVILDDVWDMGHLSDKLVYVNDETGLTEENANDAITILGQPILSEGDK